MVADRWCSSHPKNGPWILHGSRGEEEVCLSTLLRFLQKTREEQSMRRTGNALVMATSEHRMMRLGF